MGTRKTPKLAPSASSSAPPPPWIELPGDVTANILQRLGVEEMLCAQRVCSTWWKACKDPAMWRVIDLSFSWGDATAICRRAVDRSQGQLVDLTVYFFGDEMLINYVADRSRNLKRLELVLCDKMSGFVVTRAVEKLGQLEELHLSNISCILPCHIQAIANSCPKLKSFSFNDSKCRVLPDFERYIMEQLDHNLYAEAIAEGMPNLHHLQLIKLGMQNEGLEAILDGCPRLESLDIRLCYDLDLGGDLGKRCREEIKDLRLPGDSVGDVSWILFEQDLLDDQMY